MESVLDTLRQSTLFGCLPAESLINLATAVRPRKLTETELVFREGEPCTGFYLVAEGTVRVYKVAPDGRERTLHIVRPPHAFAEAALFLPGGYPAFAMAQEPSRVLFVPRVPFENLLRSQPETALRVFQSLSLWLHRLLDQLETQTFLSARTKLANYLLRESRLQDSGTNTVQIELSQPRKTIASQLGMSPETLSRAQSDLETRGLIRVDGKVISIPNLESLQEAVLTDGT